MFAQWELHLITHLWTSCLKQLCWQWSGFAHVQCWVDLWVLRRSSFFKQIILHVNKVNIFIVKCALTLSVSGNTVPTKWLLNGKEGGVHRHYGARFYSWTLSWHRQHLGRSGRICCITHWLYQVRHGTLQINFLSRYFWTSASNQADKEHLWLQ